MVQRKDLVDIGDNDYQQRQGEYIQCQDCGESFGGTRGDFFMQPMDYIFKCPDPDCNGQNVALVKDIITQKIIKV